MSQVPRASIVAAFIVGSVACKNGEPVKPVEAADGWRPQRRAEVYFSTEVSGYVEPCGCTSKPLGGLPRLAAVIGKPASDRALIDAGNLLFPSKGMSDVTREQHLLKARFLSRAYRTLGAVALNVAESDLHGGTKMLKELQLEGATPFVSANVRASKSGPTIARSFVRKIGGIKVGITGVATAETVHAAGAEVTVLEHMPMLASEVQVLRDQHAEVVIVLAHVGEAGAREIARNVTGIDVIIRSPGTPIERSPSAPRREGDVIIAEAGSQGQHVGRLTLAFGGERPARPIQLDDAEAKEVRRRQRLERKIRAYRMEADAWSVDPAKAKAVLAKKAQIQKLVADLERPRPEAEPVYGPHLKFDLIPLSDDIVPDPAMTKLLGVYYRKLQEMNLEKGDVAKCAPQKEAATFVGTAKCVECHEEAYAFWKKTKHAVAWATLEDQGKHFDLTCIGCHTVGYEKPGGFCRLKDVGHLKDVGCENCHGPGSVHIEDQDPSSIVLESPEATCAGECHVPEHSDAFVYETYLREITGPGHELDEG